MATLSKVRETASFARQGGMPILKANWTALIVQKGHTWPMMANYGNFTRTRTSAHPALQAEPPTNWQQQPAQNAWPESTPRIQEACFAIHALRGLQRHQVQFGVGPAVPAIGPQVTGRSASHAPRVTKARTG